MLRTLTGKAAIAFGTAWLYAAGTFAYLPLFGADLSHLLGPDPGDSRLVLYLLEWGRHQIHRSFAEFWNLPIFYPESRMTLLSDHLLGLQLVYAPAVAAGLTPTGAYNVLFVGSFVLGGWSAWWVLRQWGCTWFPAFLGGWLWAFSHARWWEALHLQVLWAPTFFPTLWSFDRLLEKWSWRRAMAFLAFFWIQISAGIYLSVYLLLGCLALLVARGPGKLKRWLAASPIGGLAWVFGGVVVANLLFIRPYLDRPVSISVEEARLEQERYGTSLGSFFAPSRNGWTDQLGLLPTSYRGALFLGFVPSVAILWVLASSSPAWRGRWRSIRWAGALGGASLAAAGLRAGDLATWGTPWKIGRILELGYVEAGALFLLGAIVLAWALRPAGWGTLLQVAEPRAARFLALAALGVLLTLPMTLHLLQLGISPLRSLRVSSRAFILVLPLACSLFALGCQQLLRAAGGRGRRVLVGGLLWLLFAAELMPYFPEGSWRWVPSLAEEFPPYVHQLAGLEGVRAYLELPLLPGWQETERMHHQTLHWKPLVNGYSGYIPPSYWEWAALWDPVPTDEGLERLRRGGITHLVFHRDVEQPAVRDRIEAWFEEQASLGRVRLEYLDQQVRIVEFRSRRD